MKVDKELKRKAELAAEARVKDGSIKRSDVPGYIRGYLLMDRPATKKRKT